jgi:hypothetical protein
VIPAEDLWVSRTAAIFKSPLIFARVVAFAWLPVHRAFWLRAAFSIARDITPFPIKERDAPVAESVFISVLSRVP